MTLYLSIAIIGSIAIVLYLWMVMWAEEIWQWTRQMGSKGYHVVRNRLKNLP